MQYHDLFKLQQARERLEEKFKDVPKRSPKTSAAASFAAWNRYGPAVLNVLKRIKDLAHHAHQIRYTEYVWIRDVTKKIEAEVANIRKMLDECSLGSEEK